MKRTVYFRDLCLSSLATVVAAIFLGVFNLASITTIFSLVWFSILAQLSLYFFWGKKESKKENKDESVD